MSNTAFRGFGGVQANFIVESVIDDIAAFLKEDPIQVFQNVDVSLFFSKSYNCGGNNIVNLCMLTFKIVLLMKYSKI